MAIKIITDSASDISQAEANRMGVTVIPMLTIFPDAEYRDGVDITHEEFFDRLMEQADPPTTTQISPAEFLDVFQVHLVNPEDEVIYIGLSSGLSGCYESACMAYKLLDKAQRKRLFVVDSKNATVGERILVQYALHLVGEGLKASKVAKMVEKRRKDVRLIALLDTLEYLRRGGRISKATAVAGSLLSIKPVIAIEKGKVSLVGKARGSKNGNNLLTQLVDKSGGMDATMPFCLAYSGTSDRMLMKYARDNQDLYGLEPEQLPVSSIGSVIGTHAGPGAIAVAFFAAK